MRAVNLLRPAPHYRREAFSAGLAACGYRVLDQYHEPHPGDALLIWNRYGFYDEAARRFEAAGCTVYVAENAMLPIKGYSIARGNVAMTGGIIPAGPARFGVDCLPWTHCTGQPVILAQRQIGAPGIASPVAWAESAQRRFGGRIRLHPGTGPCTPLENDIAGARCVITWSSAAAIRALIAGVPVLYEHPDFVGAAASLHVSQWGRTLKRCDDARDAVMARLTRACWTLDEIASGIPFAAHT